MENTKTKESTNAKTEGNTDPNKVEEKTERESGAQKRAAFIVAEVGHEMFVLLTRYRNKRC